MRIKEFLEGKLESYLDILREMVSINSYTANPSGVNELSILTANKFTPLGFEPNWVESVNPNFGKHLVLSRQGKSTKIIGLISHLDTVFPSDEVEKHNFHWKRESRRIYGPGVIDVKGGTLMILAVMDAFKEFFPDEFNLITWKVLLNSSEERLSKDFGELCLRELSDNTLAALVFEAGKFSNNMYHMVTKRKGMANFHITVEGKSSHAGSSHKEGANAIISAARTLIEMDQLTNYSKEVTVNIGTVSGGVVPNRVPHFAESRMEMRAFDITMFEDSINLLLDYNDNTKHTDIQNGYHFKTNVQLYHRTDPWMKNKATDQLLEIWVECAKEQGFSAVPEARGGLSDGNYLWHTIPTLDGLGPFGGNAHCSEKSQDGSKDQEFLTISSFVPKAELNIKAIIKLVGMHT